MLSWATSLLKAAWWSSEQRVHAPDVVGAARNATIPEHVIWRLTKNGRHAEARLRVVAGRPELRIYVQHPTPGFQLLWSKIATQDAGCCTSTVTVPLAILPCPSVTV